MRTAPFQISNLRLLRKVINAKITTKTQRHKIIQNTSFNKIQFLKIWCFRAFVVKKIYQRELKFQISNHKSQISNQKSQIKIMENKNDIILAEYKRLKTLYSSLLIGCIVFLALTFFLTHKFGGYFSNDKKLCLTFWYISIFLIALIPLAYFLFKRKIDKIMPDQDFYEKLAIYRSAFFIKIVLIETACFINTAILLLTNNQNILYQIMIILIVMLLNSPYRIQMTKDLKMEEEKTEDSE